MFFNNKFFNLIARPAFVIAGFILLSGCVKNFEKYNTSRLAITDEMNKADNLAINGLFIQMQKSVIPAGSDATNEVNQYQLAQNLQGDIWSGYMAVTNSFGGPNNSHYSLRNWINEAFNRTFRGVLPAWQSIKEQTAAEPNNESYKAAFAMAQIIKVFAVSRTTDMYGPLPYFRFGSGATYTPYDSQEDIYKSFFKDLDSAMLVLKNFLSQSGGVYANNNFDLVYGGNYNNWLKFANTLKLRLAMRIAYADAVTARQQAESTVTSGYGFIENNADNAELKSNSIFIVNNPIKWIQDEYNDIRMGASIESFLKGYNDPRLNTLFLPSATGGVIRGIRTGINIGTLRDAYIANYSKLNISLSTPVPWLLAAETHFLKAEGALRGWNMGGTAKDMYERGVTIAFEHAKASGVTAYLNDNTSRAASYTDVLASGNNSAAPPSITIRWNETQPFDSSLCRIITQKWIALFPDGQEAWTEFRRTGYPKIFPVVVNQSGGLISTSLQIRRIRFPDGEVQNNAQGVAQGVQLLGGADNGGTKLWWDKK